MRLIDRIPRRFALAIALMLTSAMTVAQRLPGVALPQHYTLQLTPNLQAATFTGKETIDLTLAQAADAIVLNAWQLQFDAVTAELDGKSLGAASIAGSRLAAGNVSFCTDAACRASHLENCL